MMMIDKHILLRFLSFWGKICDKGESREKWNTQNTHSITVLFEVVQKIISWGKLRLYKYFQKKCKEKMSGRLTCI